jgi:hypothetical protein
MGWMRRGRPSDTPWRMSLYKWIEWTKSTGGSAIKCNGCSMETPTPYIFMLLLMVAAGNARFLVCSLTKGRSMIISPYGGMEHIYQFYLGLMGSEGKPRVFSLAHNMWDAHHRV